MYPRPYKVGPKGYKKWVVRLGVIETVIMTTETYLLTVLFERVQSSYLIHTSLRAISIQKLCYFNRDILIMATNPYEVLI